MAEPLLDLRRLRKAYGALVVTDDVSLSVAAGGLHAIIGPNGAGKTTLINQLSGEIAPDAGTLRFADRDITREPVFRRALLGLGRSYQITSVFPEFDALTNVMLAVQGHTGHSFSFWRALAAEAALVERAHAALAEVGLAARARVPVAALAHGERRQLEMAMTLAPGPRLLLLDEPMAGMGTEESQRMIELLSKLKQNKTIILVEHDMDAVFRLADRISVLVYGRVIATGTPEEIKMNDEVRKAYLGEEV